MMRPTLADSCALCGGRRRVAVCASGELELARCLHPDLPVMEVEGRPLGNVLLLPCPGSCGTAAAVAQEFRVEARA